MAFFLTNMTNQSVAEFGGYTTKYMRNPAESPVYVSAQDSPYWLMKIQGFSVGKNATVPAGYAQGYLCPNSSKGIVDTGTSQLYVPSPVWDYFF